MSVLKSKRKTSRLEFLHNAYVIRRQFTLLLLRDFGTRSKVRTSRFYTKINRMSSEDQELFQNILDKYEISTVVDDYPEWIINEFRNRIMYELRMLVRNITFANTIYPTSESEYNDRRRYQTAAIGCCEQLIQEMQYFIDVVDVDVNKYLPYVDMIEREIALLRGWRKSDNRLLRGIEAANVRKLAEQELDVEKVKQELKVLEKMKPVAIKVSDTPKKNKHHNKPNQTTKDSITKQPIKQSLNMHHKTKVLYLSA